MGKTKPQAPPVSKGLSEEMTQRILSHIHTRVFMLDRAAIDKEKRSVPMTFSSETPVERFYGYEILSHDPAHIRMDRWNQGAPLLMDHNPRDQRGIIENGKLDNGVVRGDARISRHARGEELFMDLQDGIRPATSMGYAIHKMRELTPQEMPPDLQQKCLENKCGAFISEDWEPLEGSSVAVPADPSVGLGRSLTDYFSIPANEPGAGDETTHSQPSIRGALQMEKQTGTESPAPPLTPEELQKLETVRVEEINAIATRLAARFPGGKEAADRLAKDAIDLKLPVEKVRWDFYSRVNDSKPLGMPASFLDLSGKDIKRYSISRAIMSLLPNSKVDGSFERECSDEIAKRYGKAPQGIFLPYDRQLAPIGSQVSFQRDLDQLLKRYQIGQRTLNVTSATAGGDLVATNLLAANFIEVLRNKLIAVKAGVQLLSGLVGAVAIPKQTAAGTAYWITTEGNAITSETDQTWGQATLSPHNIGAYTDFTRQLLLQSTPSVDMLVQDDLVGIIALGIDLAVFHGTAANGQPRGIANQTSVGAVDGAGFGWPAAVDLETDVRAANADIDSMNYVVSATVNGLLKQRTKVLNFPVYLVENGMMNGYPVLVSNQITSTFAFFGAFSQCLLGEWGITDLLVDPYTGSSAGNVRVRVLQTVDVAVRHAEAFTVATGVN